MIGDTMVVNFPDGPRRVPCEIHVLTATWHPFGADRMDSIATPARRVPADMPGWRFLESVGGSWIAVWAGS